MTEIFEKIKIYLNNSQNNSTPIVKYKTPSELNEIFNFKVENKGIDNYDFLNLIDKYIAFSVHTTNKQFFNQLYSGYNIPAFIGELITTVTNTSMYSYEVAPVATMIENEMINLMNSYIGYINGEGIFMSGGSNGNLVAMLSARNRILPDCQLNGYDKNKKLVAFVNEFSHYSFDTAANVLCIGARNVIKIKADENGKMMPKELDKEIKNAIDRNETPFFVAVTCATTLMGAYDPINEISKICSKYNIWLHADGSFGGSLILSRKYNYLLEGIEKTDSFVWNPHKLMNIPLICSALLVKKKGTLLNNITDIKADYLYHDMDSIEDLGKKSLQCGRRVDAVKLWFAWKYFGKDGYQKRIDNLIEMAIYSEKKVKELSQLQLLVPRQSFTICFRCLSKISLDHNEFNLEIRENLRKKGDSIVNYGYIKGLFTFRLVTTNGDLSISDIDLFFSNLISEVNNVEKKYSTFLKSI